jgi:hypothetical protein
MLLTLKLSPTYFQRWCPGVSELQTWHARRCRCTASLGDILVSPSHKVDRAGSVRASGMGHNFARNPMTCCSKGTSEVQFASFLNPLALAGAARTHRLHIYQLSPERQPLIVEAFITSSPQAVYTFTVSIKPTSKRGLLTLIMLKTLNQSLVNGTYSTNLRCDIRV